jgi:hypothetical protein
VTASIAPAPHPRHSGWTALLLGVAIFGLLWVAGSAYRRVYVARVDDVTALADGLLLVPGARWEDWFTHGHSNFFDPYPEWPRGLTAFARPAFQSVIYLAHFVLGSDWASYLAINYLGVAGVAAVAFAVARTALGLGVGAALLAAALVLLSPAVLEFSIWQVGFASESQAGILVGCAFLAVLARRDLLCVVLLMIALLTKETAVWAPFAAALTVLLRSDRGDGVRYRAGVAASMLLPVALWLGFRFAFYGGIGGTYATMGYSPLLEFLKLSGWKLAHLDRLFIMQDIGLTEDRWPNLDRAFRIGTATLLLLLVAPWALAGLRAAFDRLSKARRERRWPTADSPLLVTLWATMGLAFFFALPLRMPGYSASAVMFAWPAVVGELARRGKPIFWLGVAVCFVLSLAQTLHFLVGIALPPLHAYMRLNFRTAGAMETALRQAPAGIRQIFVVSSPGALAPANPMYLRAFLDLSPEIVHVVTIDWNCSGVEDRVAFDHGTADGVVTLSAVLPDCASFEFAYAAVDGSALVDHRIRRNDFMTYELPEAHSIEHKSPIDPALELGRRMIVQIRPRGPARFIIEHGGADGGPAWFDAP